MTTQSKHVTVAVVGAGMAGQAHAFGYRNATMHPDLAGVDVRLAVIVDSNAGLAASAADRYGFAAATTDLDAVLDDGIDGVSLALPNFAYAEVIPRLIAAGKHVLAEKPLGRSAAEAYRFAAAADAAGLVHGVGFSFRRLPAIEAIAQVIAAGGIGDIWHATAWYLTDYAATPDTPLSWRYDNKQAAAARSWTSARTYSPSWSRSPGRSAAWSPRTPGSSSPSGRCRPARLPATVRPRAPASSDRSPPTTSPRRSSSWPAAAAPRSP